MKDLHLLLLNNVWRHKIDIKVNIGCSRAKSVCPAHHGDVYRHGRPLHRQKDYHAESPTDSVNLTQHPRRRNASVPFPRKHIHAQLLLTGQVEREQG